MANPTLSIAVEGAPPRRIDVTAIPITIGRSPENVVTIDHLSVSVRHASLKLGERGESMLVDLGSTNGTRVNGRKIKTARLRGGERISFGDVACVYACEREPLFSVLSGWIALASGQNRFFWISLILHATLIALLASVVLSPRLEEESGFEASEGALLQPSVQTAPQGSAAAGDPLEALAEPAAPQMPAISDSVVAALTTSAIQPTSFKMSVPNRATPNNALPNLTRGLGGSRGVSAGFGKGSGLGQGLSEWIGSGEGGIGISGRGKTLKTVNEFSCYFVIHSGDWYAALDWREAGQGRQNEVSAQGLPDSTHKNYQLYQQQPKYDPATGPFLSYGWGYRDLDGGPQDARGGLWEFTPGAMSNMLQFLRIASDDAIKGRRKPTAVVLDRKLVPYTYEKRAKQITWNPEGREALRENLRKHLPGGDFFGLRGYLWNPQPAEKTSSDFLVEYLLDVKPMPPFIYFTGNDDFTLTDVEVDTLYQYVLKGGAIWGDSGFAGEGSKFDMAFRREIRRVFPQDETDFHPLARGNTTFLSGADAYFDLPELPPGMQYYQAPIEVIEIRPGVISVVLTKNAYGNFLRYEMAFVNNTFQIGGSAGRGRWVNEMWDHRDEFFRGLDDDNIRNAYALASNVLVYMLGRWPAMLNQQGGSL